MSGTLLSTPLGVHHSLSGDHRSDNPTTLRVQRERPILFSGPMVRAILAGAKTQTRRIVDPQPATDADICERHETTWRWAKRGPHGRSDYPDGELGFFASRYGLPSDLLWVRETFSAHGAFGGDGRISYRADIPDGKEPHGLRWKPSIFMRRKESRLTLQITAVRVERLQDISEADAIAEGVRTLPAAFWRPTWQETYLNLWEDINGRDSRLANPWVWVIDFRRATQP